jgi:hypothetical protein
MIQDVTWGEDKRAIFYLGNPRQRRYLKRLHNDLIKKAAGQEAMIASAQSEK